MAKKKHEDEWPELIGRFMIACGQIELLLIDWVDLHSTDPIVQDIAIDMALSKRLQLMATLLKRSNLPKKNKTRGLEICREIAKISELRNIIAHNPSISHKDENGNDDYGIVDIKKFKGVKKGEFVPLMPIRYNDIAKSGRQLLTLIHELVKITNRKEFGEVAPPKP